MNIPSIETLQDPRVLFVICLFCGIGVPFPEELIAMLAGAAVASGDLPPIQTWLALCVGIFCRDLIVWAVGHWLGDRLDKTAWVQRWVGRDRLARAQRSITGSQVRAVLLGRITIGMRPPYFLVASASGVRLRTMLLVDSVGVVATSSLLMLAGAFIGPSVGTAVRTLSAGPVVGVILLAVVFYFWQRAQTSTKSTTDP